VKDKHGNEIEFQFKTRAACPLRYYINNYIDYLDYEVTRNKGKYQSYKKNSMISLEEDF
jgi:hypothetical protein